MTPVDAEMATELFLAWEAVAELEKERDIVREVHMKVVEELECKLTW